MSDRNAGHPPAARYAAILPLSSAGPRARRNFKSLRQTAKGD